MEPILTDAASSEIINGIILPAFRSGHMEQGITLGTQAIISVLGGNPLPQQPTPVAQLSGLEMILLLLFIGLFIWFAARHPLIAAILLSNSSSRFGSSGTGGFSGGGGSFGGGGASGSW